MKNQTEPFSRVSQFEVPFLGINQKIDISINLMPNEFTDRTDPVGFFE